MSEPAGAQREQRALLNASAVMAAGTALSRFSGFFRSALLVAALGNVLRADLFTLSNTVPNMLYILLAGGMINAVLVPQLVRAMKHDPDGGQAYAQRVVTLAGVFLLVVTAVLVAAAPWLMDVFLHSSFDDPALAEHRQSVIDLARYCLPQVFFYGMYVLVGQILNAHGRFGPMMWAPIANNVISIAVLVVYLLVFGGAVDVCQDGAAGVPPTDSILGPFTAGQEALLGLGSTLGIAVQFLILVPYLRAAGFRFSPRWDFRDAGLGHTLRLGLWTVLFVVVNQIAYAVVVRLASGGTTGSALSCDPMAGTGYTVYSSAFLIVMVPHSIVTVSLATALLPTLARKAADADLGALADRLAGGLRTALAVIVPFALLLPVVAADLARVLFGYGAGRETYSLYVLTLALFGPAVLMFTVHYLVLRGFYALEETRTVFFIQCVIAATNIALALLVVSNTDDLHTAPALVVAYGASYLVGAVISYSLLRHRLGGLRTPVLVRFGVRVLLAAGLATAAAYGVSLLLDTVAPDRPSNLMSLGLLLLVSGVDAAIFLLLARLMRIREVTDVLQAVTGRMRSR